MKRRENRLPEWTRTIWTSQAARLTWEPRIQRVGALTAELELRTVAEGVRRAAWIFVGPDELPARTVELAARGLAIHPILRSGILGAYASQGLRYQEGQPWHYRALVVRDGGHEFVDLGSHFITGNNEAIGEALGYPTCCRKFFERVWVREKWLDTTWPMASGDDGERTVAWDESNEQRETVKTLRFDVSDRWPANILGRWAGVRAVPWLPCSFTCTGTVGTWIEGWESLAREIDAQALEWLETLLCASWRWSALHGIAEIETSIFKVSTRTDTCDETHVVEYAGAELEAGTTGTRFPFQVPKDPQLTKSRSFAAGLEALSKKASQDPDASFLWTDNGFSSLEAMDEAHNILLDAAPILKLKPGATVLDLGCGNGRLLQRLGAFEPELNLYGIEAHADRCRRAGSLAGRISVTVYEGSMFDPKIWADLDPALVFFMPGRILELRDADERAERLRGLLARSWRVVFYSYGDWIKRGDIVQLLADAGFGKWQLATCIRGEHAQAVEARYPIAV